MYAVFRSGGKQYRAGEGERLRVEKIDAEEGADVSFDEVLLVGEGSDIKVGTPVLADTAVNAKVLSQGKSRKVPVVKFKRRQNYLRQGSHRQFFTEVEITSIGKSTAGRTAPKAGEADKPAAKASVAKKAAKKAQARKPAAKKAAASKAPAKKAASKKAPAKKAAGKKASKKSST